MPILCLRGCNLPYPCSNLMSDCAQLTFQNIKKLFEKYSYSRKVTIQFKDRIEWNTNWFIIWKFWTSAHPDCWSRCLRFDNTHELHQFKSGSHRLWSTLVKRVMPVKSIFQQGGLLKLILQRHPLFDQCWITSSLHLYVNLCPFLETLRMVFKVLSISKGHNRISPASIGTTKKWR